MGSKKKGLRFLLISIYVITLIINLLGAGFNSYAEEMIVAGSFRTTMDNDIRDKTSIQSYTSNEANKDRFENEVPTLYEKYHWEYVKDGNKQYAYFDTEDDLDAYKPLKATVNVYFTLYCNDTNDYNNQTYYKVHVNENTTLADVLNQNKGKGIHYIDNYFRYNTAFAFFKVKKPNTNFGDYGMMEEDERIVEDIILAQKQVGTISTPSGHGGGYSGGSSYKLWSFYSGVNNYELKRVQVRNTEAFNEILGSNWTLSSSTSSEQKPVVDNYNKVLDSKPTLYKNWHWSKNQSADSYDKLYFLDSRERVSEINTTEFYATVNVYFTVSTSEGGNRKYYHKHIVRENKFNDIISNFSNEDFFKSFPTGGKWYIIEDCEGVKSNLLSEETEVDKDVILEYRLPTPTPPTIDDVPSVETPTKPAVETPTKPAVVIPTKPAVETPTKPAIVIPTKPAVETPTKPAVVIPTKPSVETPTEPAVKTPTEPAVAPEPTLPVYPIDRLPDPNSPDSPDELVAIDEDGSPLGKYVKRKKPDGKNEYVIEEDLTPQGDTKKPTLPQTGGVPDWLYIALGNVILVYGLLKMKENIKE